MRTSIVLLLLAMLPLGVLAGPKEDLLHNQRIQRSAMELIRVGSSGSAVSQLRQNLRPERGPGGDTVGLVQNLIEMAGLFHNRREMNLARITTTQAVVAAEPILNGLPQISVARRADLYSSLGVLHEIVMFDLKGAQAFYDAAGALNPANEINRRRMKAVVEKQKLHPGGGR